MHAHMCMYVSLYIYIQTLCISMCIFTPIYLSIFAYIYIYLHVCREHVMYICVHTDIVHAIYIYRYTLTYIWGMRLMFLDTTLGFGLFVPGPARRGRRIGGCPASGTTFMTHQRSRAGSGALKEHTKLNRPLGSDRVSTDGPYWSPRILRLIWVGTPCLRPSRESVSVVKGKRHVEVCLNDCPQIAKSL